MQVDPTGERLPPPLTLHTLLEGRSKTTTETKHPKPDMEPASMHVAETNSRPSRQDGSLDFRPERPGGGKSERGTPQDRPVQVGKEPVVQDQRFGSVRMVRPPGVVNHPPQGQPMLHGGFKPGRLAILLWSYVVRKFFSRIYSWFSQSYSFAWSYS